MTFGVGVGGFTLGRAVVSDCIEVDVLSLEAFNGERWQTGRAEQSPNLFHKNKKKRAMIFIRLGK